MTPPLSHAVRPGQILACWFQPYLTCSLFAVSYPRRIGPCSRSSTDGTDPTQMCAPPRVRLRERVFTSPLLPGPAPRDHSLHFKAIPSLSNCPLPPRNTTFLDCAPNRVVLRKGGDPPKWFSVTCLNHDGPVIKPSFSRPRRIKGQLGGRRLAFALKLRVRC
jgi:hypothetical protein